MIQRAYKETSNDSTQKEDTFVTLLGHFGKWQFLVIAPIILVKLSSGWVQLGILFLTPSLTFWCTEFESNSSFVVANSTCYEDCTKYAYDTTPFENTIVSEWDLVCKRAWMASFTQTMLQLGILIGSIVFGFLSDRYGRRKSFLASVIFLIGFGFSVPFSPNYETFTAFRFFLGMATSGTMVTSFVIVMEAVGARYRELIGCLYQIPFVIAHAVLPAFAYYYRNWNSYSLALAVPSLIYLSYIILVSESPRWLLSVGKVDEAKKIVERAAKMNNRPITNIDEILTKVSMEAKSKADKPKRNYSDLLRPSLRSVTVCSFILWFVVGITFFGFNQYISQTSENPFISVTVAGLIQIPADLSTIWLIKKFGRKATTASCFCLAGLCIITLGCIPDNFWINLCLSSLGVSFTAIDATAIYIYTSELYPTVVRNMGMGMSSTAMRIGSMLAPFVSNQRVPWIPTVIFGLAPIAASLVTLLLPETKGRVLPDTLEDITTKSQKASDK